MLENRTTDERQNDKDIVITNHQQQFLIHDERPEMNAVSISSASMTTNRTEKEKMLAGEFYQAFDEELLRERQHAKELCFQLNTQIAPSETEKRNSIVKKLLGVSDDANTWVEPPFYVDYGIHLKVGKNFYANHGVTILDCNRIQIGDNCLLAPNVCISAATHPIDPTLRKSGAEYTMPIVIGDNVWIGANATICPGVTIGDNVVVGAGAVVTKDFPPNVVIGGVPAKIIKKTTTEEADNTEKSEN